jgi:hypothetical protein
MSVGVFSREKYYKSEEELRKMKKPMYVVGVDLSPPCSWGKETLSTDLIAWCG